MSNSISSINNYSYAAQVNARSMQQHNDDLFSKIDSNSDSGIDKTEFSDFAKKLSENSGNSFNADGVFSTYDTDGDGTLSKDELKTFMKDNPPPPPPPAQMQNAMSAYGADQSDDQMSSLLDFINNLSANNGSASSDDTSSLSSYLSKLIENFNSGTSNSLIDVTT